MLVVTSSVGMLYWIFSHTPNLGPAVALNRILVVGVSSLEEGLIGTSTSSNNSNLGTDTGLNSLLSSRGKTKTSGSLVIIVGNDNGEASRSTSKSSTVSNLTLNVTHNGTLWNGGKRKNVSNDKSSLLSTVNELTSVHTLSGNHEFRVALETVGIHKLNLGKGGTSTRVVDDLLDDSTNVTVFLGIIEGTELGGSLAGTGVRLEDGGFTLPLCLL